MKNTLICYSFDPRQLIKSINWVRADGRYVIVDPNNSQLLLYLDEKQYNKFVITSIANDKTLTVLVTPDDSKETASKRFQDPSSPLGGLDTPLKFPKLSKMFTLLDGWVVKESMILFKRNFEQFLPIYHRDMLGWLGIRTSSASSEAITKFSNKVNVIYKSEGINQLIITFKIYSIAVLQYISGNPLKSTQDLGRRVKLINGLPARIPAHFRHLIRQNDLNSIRVILTLLHSFKGWKGIWGKPNFDSITAPRFVPKLNKGFQHLWNGMDEMLHPRYTKLPSLDENWDEVNFSLEDFWKDFNPNNKVIPKLLPHTEKLMIPLTAGANVKTSALGSAVDSLAIVGSSRMYKLFKTFLREAEDVHHRYKIETPHKVYSIMTMIEHQALTLSKALSKDNTMNKLLKTVPHLRQTIKDPVWLNTGLSQYSIIIKTLRLGKLAIKLEAAGKVRVFAISDYWTQNMMKPLHKSIFELLRNHSCDATFDQEGRVTEFSKRGYTYIASYDLKSATDLIPIQLYEKVLGFWTSPRFSKAWSSVLTDRDYFYEGRPYRYTRGQPMGALSSWGSLALIHHYLVFLSAQRVKKYKFRDYLVLGDDIVIADENVANAYCDVCRDYGITIGLPKSFVSRNGMFQFASQNFIGENNISPLSLKEVLACSGNSFYFSENFNLSKRVEWIDRLLRRGYLNTDKTVSLIRPLLTARENKLLSENLFKGIIPSKLGETIVTILSKFVFAKLDNSVSMDQFICSLRTNIGLVDHTIVVPRTDKLDFMKLYYKVIKGDISKLHGQFALSLSLSELNEKLDTTLPGTRLSLDQSLLESNSSSIERFVSLHAKAKALIKEIDILKEAEKWEVLWNGYEKGGLMISPQMLAPLFLLKMEMESLVTKRNIFNKAMSSVDTKVPYLTQLQLSLMSELDYRSSKGTVIMGR